MLGISIGELGIVIYLILWIAALVDILRSKFKKHLYVFLWLLAIFIVPFAVIAYFIFGPQQVVHGGLRLLRRKPMKSIHE
jgi:cbb3-type cytochrome oxidase subunit 1